MTRFQVKNNLHQVIAKVGTSNLGVVNTAQSRSKLGIRKTGLALVAATTVFVVTAIQETVHAATVGFTNSVDLAANDSVDWGILGDSLTTVSNPFNINSVGGNTLNVSQRPGNNFQRRDQNNGWNGNFLPREKLLWTGGNNGPVEISFANPISRIGTQIQANAYGSFLATITAFDGLGNILGSFTRNDGNSTDVANDLAIFLGIGSDADNIAKVILSVGNTRLSEDFAINSLQLLNDAEPVPEPMTILGTFTAGAIGAALRRKSQLKAKETAQS